VGDRRRQAGASEHRHRKARRARATREITSGLSPADVVLATKFDNLKDGLAAKVVGVPGVPGEAKLADRRAPDGKSGASN